MRRLWFAALSLLALGTFARAHEITFSHVEVRLEQQQTLLTVKLPIKALMHEEPSPLPEGTSEQELRSSPLSQDVQASLTKLLTERLHIASGETVVSLTISRIESAGEDVAIMAWATSVDGALRIQANLFPAGNLHKMFVNIYRAGGLAGQYALDRDNTKVSLVGQRPLRDILATFIGEGIRHIFIGPDHILFVVALILLGGTLRSQVKIITAFTIAHSLTLALATLNVVQLPTRLVESAIALSVVAVGLHDLRQLRSKREAFASWDLRVALAFGFGLVHGFGFASVLTELDLPKQALAWSLAAFNIGVEIAQIVILLLAAPLLFALRRYAPPRLSHGLLTAAACAVTLVGCFWLYVRVTGA